MSSTKNSLNQKIMKKIESGQVKMRPRFFFTCEKTTLVFLIVVSVLLSLVLINLAVFILKKNGTLEFFEFGLAGTMAVLENIPYPYLIWSMVFFILAHWIFRSFDLSYQKYAHSINIGFLVLILIIGVSSATLGLNEKINQTTFAINFPIIKNAYQLASPKNLKNNYGLLAVIQEVNPQYTIARTSTGEILMIGINNQGLYEPAEEEISPYQLKTRFRSLFNDPLLEDEFNQMILRHKAMVAHLEKIQAANFNNLSAYKFSNNQIIKIIGRRSHDSFQPYHWKTSKNTIFSQ